MKELNSLGELTIGYKYNSNINNRPKVSSSSDAYDVIKKVFDKDCIGLREQFVVMYLNNANKVIGLIKLFEGATSNVLVDNKLVVAPALKLMATAIIVSHNHPSGNLSASDADLKMTESLKQACMLFSISLLDHLIITPDNQYYSLADEGKM